MPPPLEARGSNYLRLTPVNDSASDDCSSNQRAARLQNRLGKDTSVLSGAGVLTTPDANVNFDTPATDIGPSFSASPIQARPQLHCDTQRTTPSNSLPRNVTSTADDLPVAHRPRHDSVFKSTTSSNSESPNYASSSDCVTGALEDDDTFYSAQSSQVLEKSADSTPVRSSEYNSTTAGSQHELESEAAGSDKALSRSKLRATSLQVPSPYSYGEPSDISDAGEQQQLRQQQLLQQQQPQKKKKKRARKRNTTPSPPSRRDPYRPLVDSEGFVLQTSIFNALQSTTSALNPSESKFLPRGQLDHVINIDSVQRELRINLGPNYKDSKIQRDVKTVCVPQEVHEGDSRKLKSFRKIFAILALVEMSSSIKHFIKENVSDLDLPLVPVLEEQIIVGFRRRDAAGQDPRAHLLCFEGQWSPSKRRLFEKDQWIMLAPFFSQGEDGEAKHYILQDHHVLPFVNSDQAAEYRGGYAKVTMVCIHPDHHNFKDALQCERGFAIKQLYSDDREVFKRERRILKKFSGPQSHDHVVSLLATYEQHKRFNFIFHRAEGDLSRFWKEIVRQPVLNYPNVLWMAKQCCGIADGLMQLHRHLTFIYRDEALHVAKKAASDKQVIVEQLGRYPYVRSETMQSSGVTIPLDSPTWISGRDALEFGDHTDAEIIVTRFGRHGDLDPSNILWYSGNTIDENTISGTLKIADFGQAKISSHNSKTTQSPVANKETYRPPECDIKPRKIRQSYDIWCLGCVYLEFVTWMLGGAKLLQKLALARLAQDGFREDYITDQFFVLVKATNSEEMEAKVKPAVNQFIDILHRQTNCTDFIHDLLNLIQQGMLVVDSLERKPCDQVKKALDEMYKKCFEKPDYASRQTPWLNGNKQTSEGYPYSVRFSQSQPVDENLLLLPAMTGRLERRKSGLSAMIAMFRQNS